MLKFIFKYLLLANNKLYINNSHIVYSVKNERQRNILICSNVAK